MPFLLRLPPALHRQLVRQAKKNHRSLNSAIIAQLLGPPDRRTVVEETINTLVRFDKDCLAEIERLRAAESHDLKVKRALRAEIERLQEMLRYIQNLPVGDELDIARRAARRALERGEP